jgi:peptidoglycan hydrolase CwlO-like protein
MTIKKIPKKIILIIFIILLGFTPFINITPEAQSSADIQKEIDKQREDLKNTKNDIEFLKNQIADSQNGLANAADGLPKLQAQLESNQKELELNEKELQLLKQENALKESIKQKLLVEQQGALDSAYQQWRIKKDNFATSAQLDDTRMNNMGTFLASKVLGFSDDGIKEVGNEINQLNEQINASETLVGNLNQQREELNRKKKEIEDAIAYYNYVINNNSGSIANLQENVSRIENAISSLTQEQRDALLEEARLAQQNGGGGQSVAGCGIFDDNNVDNNIYLCGLGNDFQQGHQVGMSQWGAHGMALNGFNAQSILTFYYTNVSVAGGYEGTTVNVQGYGSRNIEDYVAGQGEVPVKACGNQDQVNANPSKYVVDNPNFLWDCWPEEAIKAQAIAYRTYGVYNAGFMFNDARSQVYNGSQNSRWAADETRGQILTFGGSPIEALYSADNNQGFGTANNDTMFQGYSGDGTAFAYLRAVNDTQWATPMPGQYNRNWGFRTRTYSMNDINTMVNYVANTPGRFGGFSNYVQGMKNTLGGNVVTLTFERDPSLRVKKVWMKAANGNQAVMGGYWFTYMWNLYTNDMGIRNDNGSVDWLWSQTFFLHIV